MLDHNFYIRSISAIVLFAIFMFAIISGGFVFSTLILFITSMAIFEWHYIVQNGINVRSKMVWDILGLASILPSSVTLLYLRYEPQGIRSLLLLCGVVWCTDIFAYITGRIVGGIRLAPGISPKKTVAGSVGGMAAAAAFGAVFGLFSYGAMRTIFCALIISILAQLGDLLESGFKRRFGVKDSGVIIPGHGGVLDRMDSFMLSAPFMFYFVF